MFRLLTIAAFLILIGCWLTGSGPSVTSLDDHRSLAKLLREADSIELHEGLPHQHFDSELFQRELDTKPTVSFGGFPFYPSALELAEEERVTVSELFSESDSFVPHDLTTSKACGGFHPDYCLVWTVDSKRYYALFCFGCHEVKAAGNGLKLHADIDESALEIFESVLYSLGKNRPSAGQ